MWLFRGVQSAVFYYATCTPCAAANDRRRRKRQAVRSQREKAARRTTAIVTEQPRLFSQPTAFSTNEGWKEEIALGPGPPARRGGYRQPNNGSANKPEGTGLPRLSETSTTTVEDESPSRREKGGLGERFHWMGYQREDEPLWGQEEQREVPGSSVGISGRGRAEASHTSRYYIAKVPPVNDLHPPIVSGPTSRAEVRWMLQPPPPARVMAGKERHQPSVRSSRAGSIGKKDRHSRVSDVEERDDAQTTTKQLVDPPDCLLVPKQRSKHNSPQRTPTKKGHRPPPITITGDHRKAYSEEDLEDLAEGLIFPERIPLATIATRSRSVVHIRRHAYDEFHLHVSSTMNSRSNSPSSQGSPEGSLSLAEAPFSRPDSKGTDDSGKAFHPALSTIVNPLHRSGLKNVEAIHVEINEQEGSPRRDQMQPIRPWRWSFDI
jgi:hypothetical protein